MQPADVESAGFRRKKGRVVCLDGNNSSAWWGRHTERGACTLKRTDRRAAAGGERVGALGTGNTSDFMATVQRSCREAEAVEAGEAVQQLRGGGSTGV